MIQPTIEQVTSLVLSEYVFILIGIAIAEFINYYMKYRLKRLKQEKAPEELITMFRKIMKIFRPWYLGVIFIALYWTKVAYPGTWLFMFGIGLILGDAEAAPRVAVELAQHVKECVEQELEEFKKQLEERQTA